MFWKLGLCSLLASSAFCMALTPSSPSAGEAAFSAKLFHTFQKQPPNFALSPYSIDEALSLLRAGAAGKTKEELDALLGEETTPPSLPHSDTHARGFHLNLANSLWIEKSFAIKESYKKTAQEQFDAEIHPENFSKDPTRARKAINDWVANKTEQRIQNLLSAQAVSKATKAVLANALYFKANWATIFPKEGTKNKVFYSRGKTAHRVPTMSLEHWFGFYQAKNLSVIEIPYLPTRFSFVCLLPKERSGISSLEKAFTQANWEDWTKELKRTRLRLEMPRFRVESSFVLNDALKAMGATSLFDKTANLSGISPQPLEVSSAVHKAFVDVNETGTEAAAATAVMMFGASLAMQPAPLVQIDHPFLFAIRDTESNSILFLGRVEEL